MKPTDSRSAYRLERILDMLIDEDLDQKQITEKLCMTDPRKVATYLDYLKLERQAHVCGWREPGANGHRWPVYRYGKGQNKRKPKPKTNAELMRAYWRRKGRASCQDHAPRACPFGVLFKLQEQRA
jgi:hypothetical protein